MAEPTAQDEARLLDRYGVTDAETGRAGAEQAREYLLAVAEAVVREGDITMDHIVISGIVARAQSLHEGSLAAIEADNPHVAFTLLRAYAEQCAAVLYLTDKPDKARPLWDDLKGHSVPIGRITNHAERSGRMKNFRTVYGALSSYAHPTSTGLYASFRMDEDRRFSWQSAPRFKRDGEKLVAYAWCIEFAHKTHEFLFEYAEAQGLLRIVRPSESACD